MPRFANISKYWVSRFDGALAFALSKVYAMLTPSIGFLPDAVDRVRRRDTRRFQDRRHDVDHVVELGADAARSLMWPGHEIAIPCRVPPKCEAICFTHLNGVSNAHAHGTAMCG